MPGEPASLETLYPFLYAGAGDLDAVLAQVRQSTMDKVGEIIALRARVLEADAARIQECAGRMARAFAGGGRLFAFGNGGSSTDAQDLAGLFVGPPGEATALPAFGLTNDIAVLTALSNDVGFDVVFARQLGAFGRAGDIAVGLSTSGNSANLLRAFDEAARRGMVTIGIAGYDGGKMAELESIDYLFVVPSPSVHRIQEAQTTLYHALWELTLAAPADEPEGDRP
ncbi:SIS domain-containing protein [Amycolatopsis acidiphila]|uniref:SIS domain-containing protein n=1 Tax=Amycolatopsis acidiphila TaxID=715473 RepID=A0A558AGB8_9PSEU|nr:SIS domain-containing protein [Amycolatopsis acidiphila]TVT23276.1 SIS domain-containing protein [Amycolatopsis acidiphila]UIJ56499.1 SIS domain-containing protein [Amycolatopsis acidiphila]GHG66941.1 phosphoheptose isomerase [Amycolatopsis acidiphila]